MAWPCINRAGYAPHLENTTFHAWGSLHAFKSKPLPVLMSTDEPCHFNLKLTTGANVSTPDSNGILAFLRAVGE